MSPHELKALHVRRNALDADVSTLDQKRAQLCREIAAIKTEIRTIDQRISSAADREPMVSEHALLRYVERVVGIDLEQIKSRILTENNRRAIQFAGNCKIKSAGVEFIVRDRVVVSVVGDQK